MVDSRIRKLRNQRQKTRKRQILRLAACIRKEELHENYVLVPAGNIVIVVCKQYYNEVLTKELTNNSGAYIRCSEPAEMVVDSHMRFMYDNNINVPKESINPSVLVTCLRFCCIQLLPVHLVCNK